MYKYKSRGVKGNYQTKEELEKQHLELASLDKTLKNGFRQEKKRYLRTFAKLTPSLKNTLKEKYIIPAQPVINSHTGNINKNFLIL